MRSIVDAADAIRRPLRAYRGRCARPLLERERRDGAGGHSDRLAECRLELHPDQDQDRLLQRRRPAGEHEHIQFDFLGYTFQPRRAKNRWGKYFVSFLPAISTKSAKTIRGRFAMADGIHPEQPAPRRPRSSLQPFRAWLDELLRPVLPLEVRQVLRHLTWLSLHGASEIQRFRRLERASMHWLGPSPTRA